jgi:hypothetical protein
LTMFYSCTISEMLLSLRVASGHQRDHELASATLVDSCEVVHIDLQHIR